MPLSNPIQGEELVEVTQADRDAAADVWRDFVARVGEVMAEKAIRTGQMDDGGLVRTFARHRIAEQERCARVCEEVRESFLSPEYATGQPLSSINERFACAQCCTAIRSQSLLYEEARA